MTHFHTGGMIIRGGLKDISELNGFLSKM